MTYIHSISCAKNRKKDELGEKKRFSGVKASYLQEQIVIVHNLTGQRHPLNAQLKNLETNTQTLTFQNWFSNDRLLTKETNSSS